MSANISSTLNTYTHIWAVAFISCYTLSQQTIKGLLECVLSEQSLTSHFSHFSQMTFQAVYTCLSCAIVVSLHNMASQYCDISDCHLEELMSPSPVKPAIDFVPLLQCLKVMYISFYEIWAIVDLYIYMQPFYSNRCTFRKVYTTDKLFSPLYTIWDSSRENVVSFIYIKVIKIIHV